MHRIICGLVLASLTLAGCSADTAAAKQQLKEQIEAHKKETLRLDDEYLEAISKKASDEGQSNQSAMDVQYGQIMDDINESSHSNNSTTFGKANKGQTDQEKSQQLIAPDEKYITQDVHGTWHWFSGDLVVFHTNGRWDLFNPRDPKSITEKGTWNFDEEKQLLTVNRRWHRTLKQNAESTSVLSFQSNGDVLSTGKNNAYWRGLRQKSNREPREKHAQELPQYTRDNVLGSWWWFSGSMVVFHTNDTWVLRDPRNQRVEETGTWSFQTDTQQLRMISSFGFDFTMQFDHSGKKLSQDDGKGDRWGVRKQ